MLLFCTANMTLSGLMSASRHCEQSQKYDCSAEFVQFTSGRSFLSDESDLRVDSGCLGALLTYCRTIDESSVLYQRCTSITDIVLYHITEHPIMHGQLHKGGQNDPRTPRIIRQPPVLYPVPVYHPPKIRNKPTKQAKTANGENPSPIIPSPRTIITSLPLICRSLPLVFLFFVESTHSGARKLQVLYNPVSLGNLPGHFPPVVHTTAPSPPNHPPFSRLRASIHTHSSTPPSPCLPTNFAPGVMSRTRSRVLPTSSTAD